MERSSGSLSTRIENMLVKVANLQRPGWGIKEPPSINNTGNMKHLKCMMCENAVGTTCILIVSQSTYSQFWAYAFCVDETTCNYKAAVSSKT